MKGRRIRTSRGKRGRRKWKMLRETEGKMAKIDVSNERNIRITRR